MDDDDNKKSADDALEPKSDIFDPIHDVHKLAEDGAPPASPASDIHSSAPIDDPSTDDPVGPDELYQEGISGATNADDEEFEPYDEHATRIG